MWGVWELKLFFYPSAGGLKKKKNHTHTNAQTCTYLHTRTRVIAHTAHVHMICPIYMLFAKMQRIASGSISNSSRGYLVVPFVC